VESLASGIFRFQDQQLLEAEGESAAMAMSYRERQERIKANRAALEKLEAEHNAATRKRETKKLVLMGRLVEQWIKWGKIDEREFMQGMDKFLTRNYERELFGLEKLPDDQLQQETKQPAANNRPIQVPVTASPAAPAVKPDVVKTVISGRKLAEVGVSPDDFFLQ
jgi:hypothetical protein